MIELKNIHKRLGKKQVLQGLSFTVNRGETYVIIGQSGIGKSVTLKNIMGLLHPDEGEIWLMGKNLREISLRDFYHLRKSMGVLFQNGALINWLNVGENVALPLVEHERLDKGRIGEIVKENLALVGLYDVEHLMPASLSGGMKKRVGLARALVRKPEIILYDEPTSGLDPVMSNQINELILSLQQKFQVTSICVTHDMNSAYLIANKIGMLHQGRIIEEGTPEEIQANANPIIQQFIHGRTQGPLMET